MINWSKYFDKIICIHYNKMIQRKKLLEYLLKRVSILDSGIFEYFFTFTNIYEQKFKDMLNTQPFDFTLGQVNWSLYNCTKGHLDAIRQMYHRGYERILIILDDIRFLKNLDNFELILLNIPNDNLWLVILFDYFTPLNIRFYNTIKDKKRIIHEYFCNFENLTIWSAGCYCLSKLGMKRMISACDMQHYITNDTYWNDQQYKSIFNKKFICKKHLCVQALFSNAQTSLNFGFDKASNMYRNQNINFDDYMIKIDGSNYNYGDFIQE